MARLKRRPLAADIIAFLTVFFVGNLAVALRRILFGFVFFVPGITLAWAVAGPLVDRVAGEHAPPARFALVLLGVAGLRYGRGFVWGGSAKPASPTDPSPPLERRS